MKLMTDSTQTTRFRLGRWLIRFIGVTVPRRFRARFRQEWEAELEYREELLARWDRLDWRNKLELLCGGWADFGMRSGCNVNDWRKTCFKICVSVCECC